MKGSTFAMSACAAALGLAALAALGACASDHETQDAPASMVDAGPDRTVAAPRNDASVRDAARPPEAGGLDAARPDGGVCNVRIDAIPLLDSPHVPDGTLVAYNSNPPSSGPHYSTWANFQELTHPVDDGYLVHSMEHGAVLLLYACGADAGAACDALVAELRAVRDAIPDDPLCDPAIGKRMIIAPRAADDVAVAAAAWGYVYRADCVDAASLTSFVLDHYGKGPEDFCVAGQVF